MANQEISLSEAEVEEIVRLLRSTQLTIQQIAKKARVSRAVVESINRRFEVRRRQSRRATK